MSCPIVHLTAANQGTFSSKSYFLDQNLLLEPTFGQIKPVLVKFLWSLAETSSLPHVLHCKEGLKPTNIKRLLHCKAFSRVLTCFTPYNSMCVDYEVHKRHQIGGTSSNNTNDHCNLDLSSQFHHTELPRWTKSKHGEQCPVLWTVRHTATCYNGHYHP